MAISAGTTRPLRFLRRFSGNMEPPVYEFPVIQTATLWRKGDGAMYAVVTDGKVTKATGAAATGIPIATVAGLGLVGFFYGASSSAPPFPTEAGVQGAYTSPAAVTVNDPIPDNEKIMLILAMPDCIFVAHEGNGETDIVAPIRSAAAAGTGGLGRRYGVEVVTPTGETSRCMIDTSTVAGNTLAVVLEWAYPQMPAARGTTAIADPYRIRLGAGGTANPAVEFALTGTAFSTTV